MTDTTENSDANQAPDQVARADHDAEIAKRTALEGEFSKLADEMVAELPEQFRALVPGGTPAERVAWIRKARTAGAFQATAKVPTTDTTKPATTPRDADLSTLRPEARMAAGYAKR